MLTRRLFVASFALCAALGASFLDLPSAQAQSVVVSSSRRSQGPSLSLIGLGLLGGGLVTSAPGIAILAACDEGKPCHSDATTAIGWLLAGPGIPPIAIGLFFIWLDKPSSRSVYNVPQTPPAGSVRFTASPIPAGGLIGATYTF